MLSYSSKTGAVDASDRVFVVGRHAMRARAPRAGMRSACAMTRASSASGADDTPDDQRPATLDACRRCGLWEHATQPVPGTGPRHASIVLVGEQPGDQEDRTGVPFVGAAGHVLDRALDAAGIDRRSVYLTNAVKHFKWEPRGKRRLHKTPAQREITACRYWLDRELESVHPRVIVALGGTALRAVLQDNDATLQRTPTPTRTAQGYLVVATYHPSYVLRTRGADSREHAYQTLVDALRTASKLARDDSKPKAGRGDAE
ncbi:TPA: UdgX family uracil-DNA binding protein [Burkholderia multivorans]|nr:UdgX family uracil-DNA binding protein [Burkholderia multivorans]